MGKFSQPRGSAQPVKAQPRKKGRGLLITLSVIVVLLLIAVIAVIGIGSAGTPEPTSESTPDQNLILDNVTIAGIDVSGMTKGEASAALEHSIVQAITEDMVIELPDTTLTLTAADTGIVFDVEKAVESAYLYGHSGSDAENQQIQSNAAHTSYELKLEDYLSMDTEYIRSQLETYCDGYNTEFIPSSATLEGEAPILNTGDEHFDPDAPCQTIVLNTGHPGRHLDADALYGQVMDAYRQCTFTVTAEALNEEETPEDLTAQLQELYEQYASKPVDSAMDEKTFEATSEVYGYTFDLESALTMLEEADYDQTIEIAFSYTQPKVTKEALEKMLFRDVLADYKTTHTNNANRNTNLKLACAAIDGRILMPGEQFDYNKALGQRTAEAGYKAADAYSGGKTVQTLGGGICQVSSTLYYCTLIADLQIDTRVAHSYTSSYMPLGMDATVSWGGPDFRFTNNTNYPIRIEAEVSGGYVKIKLIGTDEKDYYVKMEYEVLSNTYAETVTQDFEKGNSEGYKDGQVIQTAYNGCEVQSYKCKYDKETDELISREKEAYSKYKKRDKIVVNIVAAKPEPTEAPKATEAPAPEPTKATEPPIPETTPPTEPVPIVTEAPTEPAATEAPAEVKPAETEAPEPAETAAPEPEPTEAAPVEEAEVPEE